MNLLTQEFNLDLNVFTTRNSVITIYVILCLFIIELEIVITRAAPAFHKLFMVMGLGCVFDINTVHKTGKN